MAVRQRVRFHLGQDVPLGVEQKRNATLSRREILNIVRKHCVEVARAVRSRERDVRAVVFVHQRHGLARKAVFLGRRGKAGGQGTPEPGSHLRAGLEVL